jgi:hypothetical protein
MRAVGLRLSKIGELASPRTRLAATEDKQVPELESKLKHESDRSLRYTVIHMTQRAAAGDPRLPFNKQVAPGDYASLSLGHRRKHHGGNIARESVAAVRDLIGTAPIDCEIASGQSAWPGCFVMFEQQMPLFFAKISNQHSQLFVVGGRRVELHFSDVAHDQSPYAGDLASGAAA